MSGAGEDLRSAARSSAPVGFVLASMATQALPDTGCSRQRRLHLSKTSVIGSMMHTRWIGRTTSTQSWRTSTVARLNSASRRTLNRASCLGKRRTSSACPWAQRVCSTGAQVPMARCGGGTGGSQTDMKPKGQRVYGGVSRCSQEICFWLLAHFSSTSFTEP